MSEQQNGNISWQDLLAAGKAAEALRFYLLEETYDPAVAEVLGILADIRTDLRAKRWKRAQMRLDRLEDGPFAKPDALATQIKLLESGSENLDLRKPEEALSLLADVELSLLAAEVETQRGTAYIFQNKLAEAEAAFARALELDPKHYRALTNRGNLALERNEVDEAIADYEAALKLNEEFANAHHNLGVAYRRKGQISKSVRSIRRAQRSLRKVDRDEARGAFADLRQRFGGRLLRFAFYIAIALLVFFLLRSQGRI